MELTDKGLAFPLRLSADGGLEVVPIEESVRGMLEQILFTIPGERVNRPTFGVGVQRYVFEPLEGALETRLRVALEENVYEHLGRTVHVTYLNVAIDDEQALLTVRVEFDIEGRVGGPEVFEVSLPVGGVL